MNILADFTSSLSVLDTRASEITTYTFTTILSAKIGQGCILKIVLPGDSTMIFKSPSVSGSRSCLSNSVYDSNKYTKVEFNSDCNSGPFTLTVTNIRNHVYIYIYIIYIGYSRVYK